MLNWIIEHWDELTVAIASVIAAASAVSALTPTPKDDAFFAKVKKVVDVLALNIANAKNKADK